MPLLDELTRLDALYAKGSLSSEEYSRAKAVLLDDHGAPTRRPRAVSGEPAEKVYGLRANDWAMALHLSQFAGYAVPLAGWVVPVVLWRWKRDEVPGLDAHGRRVVNWMLSMLVYLAGAAVLCVFLIGIPLLFAVLLAGAVFPILGAVKAADGQVWKYPLSIDFLGPPEEMVRG